MLRMLRGFKDYILRDNRNPGHLSHQPHSTYLLYVSSFTRQTSQLSSDCYFLSVKQDRYFDTAVLILRSLLRKA